MAIINRVSQCTVYGSNSKQTFPYNELLIVPLLLQASTQCALGFVVTSVPLKKKHNQGSRVDACNETECQGHTFPGGDLDTQLPQSPPNMDTVSRVNTTYQASAQCPAKWFTVSFRVPDAFRWLQGHFLSACLCTAAAGLARMVWNT